MPVQEGRTYCYGSDRCGSEVLAYRTLYPQVKEDMASSLAYRFVLVSPNGPYADQLPISTWSLSATIAHGLVSGH